MILPLPVQREDAGMNLHRTSWSLATADSVSPNSQYLRGPQPISEGVHLPWSQGDLCTGSAEAPVQGEEAVCM